MNQIKKITRAILLTGVMGLLPAMVMGQCRSFAKKKCIPSLAPYQFNESFNAAQLAPGEQAEVSLTFFSGQEYRVIVCSHPIIGEVNWSLKDQGGNVVFESKAEEPKESFDLKVTSTQQLTAVISVPQQKTASSMVHVGCVAILVGFK